MTIWASCMRTKHPFQLGHIYITWFKWPSSNIFPSILHRSHSTKMKTGKEAHGFQYPHFGFMPHSYVEINLKMSQICVFESHMYADRLDIHVKTSLAPLKKIDIGEWSQLRWTPSVITWLLPMAQWRMKSSHQDLQCKCGLKGLLNTCYEI